VWLALEHVPEQRPPLAEGDDLVAMLAGDREGGCEGERDQSPGLVAVDRVADRTVPAVRAGLEPVVEPHRRPAPPRPEPVVLGGQRVDQRSHLRGWSRELSLVDVVDAMDVQPLSRAAACGGGVFRN
jgi:hypothetical protein